MFIKKLFKEQEEYPELQPCAPTLDVEQDLWTVFQTIKNKDRREFNKFIDGTKSLYDAWQKFQPTLSKDEKMEQEILDAEGSLDELEKVVQND